MKKLYFLNEDEKSRILNLHGNARKRQYLSEQETTDEKLKAANMAAAKFSTDLSLNAAKAGLNSMERQKNINNIYCSLKNGVITAGTYKDVKWDDYVKEWTVLPNEIETAKKSCSNTNNSPQDKAKKAQQYKQQIITKTTDTTKQIQALLGLEKTGNMDTGLLQKINTKLNGGK